MEGVHVTLILLLVLINDCNQFLFHIVVLSQDAVVQDHSNVWLLKFILNLDVSHKDGFLQFLGYLIMALVEYLLDKFHEVFNKKVPLDLSHVTAGVAFPR